MVQIDKEWMRRDVEGWREVNRITDAERASRLRNMTDEECRQAILDVLSLPIPPDLPEPPSGLVEQQRIFHRLG